MDLRDRIADVRRRPRLYGLTTFGEAAAFFVGMDAATEGRFLDGFSAWLAARSGHGANLAWPALVIRIAYPGAANDFWVAAAHSASSAATAVLFDELDLFLMDREMRSANQSR